MYDVDFTCLCGKEWEQAGWSFGDVVQCPLCLRWFETEFETNWDDDVIGPWLGSETSEPN